MGAIEGESVVEGNGGKAFNQGGKSLQWLHEISVSQVSNVD